VNDLERIRKPIAKEIKEFEKHFRSSIQSNIRILDIITRYILRRKGKQIRPTFVLLTSSMLGGIKESTFTAATLIELLHTASLVHDDVVDESYERRGFFSLNALWKSKIAVLVGDFLLAKGLLVSVERKEYDMLELVSEAVRDMSEGELLQLRKSRKLDITMDEYFEVIGKKTAALIAACTATGARAVVEDKEVIEKMKDFGLNVGIAFQIKDDLFDYQKSGNIGKPKGNDIQEKKMTLPLIYALSNSPGSEKSRIRRIIRRKTKKSEDINTVYSFIEKYGGFEYAEKRMFEYRDSAIEILDGFPDNTSREALRELVNFTVMRKK
jgi:octaprenyl-diphosphate synthase